MNITREALVRVAKETALKHSLSDPGLVAAYLTGSLRSENPFLGNAADIDIVFVHDQEAKSRREIVPLTPEIHLDIIHHPRSLYERPRELRLHPWLGPLLYDPLPLFASRHFLEFIQAGVRDRYHEPANVLARSRRLAEQARQSWKRLDASAPFIPAQVLGYLETISLAANGLALLSGEPLAERRFLLQFPARARSAGHPGLADELLDLLGARHIHKAALSAFLPEWEKDFSEAASIPAVDPQIAPARLGYYRLAFLSMLESEAAHVLLWPLMRTWTLAASALPPGRQAGWTSAWAALGLDATSFAARLGALDHFLDSIEAVQERLAAGQGL